MKSSFHHEYRQKLIKYIVLYGNMIARKLNCIKKKTKNNTKLVENYKMMQYIGLLY